MLFGNLIKEAVEVVESKKRLRSHVEIRFVSDFFDDVGKTFITRLQYICSPQVDIILFYLGYDVFRN